MAPKVFVYALEGEPETLDPAGRFYSERAIRVKWLLYDCLVNIAAESFSDMASPQKKKIKW